MRVVTVGIVVVLMAGAGPAAGQEGHAEHEGHEASPYAGTGSDAVQTLTEEEVAQLLDGAGMGLARPAELNGYPGPRHVLDLADSLALTERQRARTSAVFDRMEQAAVEVGRQIIEAERELDQAFAAGAREDHLQRLTLAVARLRGELRWIHLRAHLEMSTVLSRHQRHEYDRLRGYGSGHGH